MTSTIAPPVVFVVTQNHAIYVRTLTSHGRLSLAQRIGTGVQSEISIASPDGNRLAVAWAWQRVDEGDATSPFHAQVACSTGAGHFTGRSHALASIVVTGTGRYVSGGGISIAKDGGGAITLAWTGYARDRFVVRTSSLNTRCATSTQTIALPGSDAILGGLAVAPSGRATIAIIAGRRGADAPLASSAITETAHGILATERPTSTTRFSAPVQVSAADDNEVEPVVAIDQTNSRSVIAWRNVATSIQFATTP